MCGNLSEKRKVKKTGFVKKFIAPILVAGIMTSCCVVPCKKQGYIDNPAFVNSASICFEFGPCEKEEVKPLIIEQTLKEEEKPFIKINEDFYVKLDEKKDEKKLDEKKDENIKLDDKFLIYPSSSYGDSLSLSHNTTLGKEFNEIEIMMFHEIDNLDHPMNPIKMKQENPTLYSLFEEIAKEHNLKNPKNIVTARDMIIIYVDGLKQFDEEK